MSPQKSAQKAERKQRLAKKKRFYENENIIKVTSPYFAIAPGSRLVAHRLPDIPQVERTSSRPGFMTLEEQLPLGPAIDMSTPCTIELDDEDIEWYKAEFRKLDDPLYAFNMRLSAYLNLQVYRAKPVLIQGQPFIWPVLYKTAYVSIRAGC
jgi:hypothetical protein